MARPFALDFYKQNTDVVARELLGQTLVHIVNGKRIAGIIVETEAYMGAEDPACHTFGDRRTSRNQSMYLEGGHAYVYLIYGMHFCFNVVTRTTLEPEAVLIRAIEPTEGLELIRANRGKVKESDLTNGPGKLCAAMKIDRSCDGLALNKAPLLIERTRARVLTKNEVIASARIGVDYAGEAAHWPLRFSLRGSNFVSKPRPEASLKL